ncbi:hypothetical protein IDM40_03275 [Nocardiopsis sp. HNM0947]|uniref:ARB-07466-like C-terminal domain-containing protein n=1 Tax=Nocardiopsis coralli TaxID=2772213 RepID=A0ABR9P1P1_9ACTN|nr:hypothetical protein [Nocardiopsis coralli]MBE2997733.1 hypothetical protein [Nocardiopsis coralli]
MTHRAAMPHRRWYGLIISVALLGVLSVIGVIGTRAAIDRIDVAFPTSTPWGPECSVTVGDEQVPLEREQAQRAATAAVADHQGEDSPVEAPDTSDIPDGAMQVLQDGPEDDAGPSMTCRSTKNPELEVEEDLEPSGLTPRAQNLKEGIEEVFAEPSLGGYEPGGYDTGHGEGSAHYDGRAIDAFFRPVNEDNRREGWQMAHWLIAYAPDYEIDVIIFDDKIWSTYAPSMGWRHYEADPDNEILRHLDHVHVDVQPGGERSDDA